MRNPVYYLSIALSDGLFRIFFLIFAIKLLLFILLTKIGTEGIFPALGIITIFVSFSLLMNKKFRLGYLISLNLLFSLVFFIHSLYFKYFNDFPSLYDLYHIHQISQVASAVTSLLRSEIFFFADFVILPLLFSITEKHRYSFIEKGKALLILLSLGILLNIKIMHDLGLIKSIIIRYDFVQRLGIFNYQIIDMYLFLKSETKKVKINEYEIMTIKNWLYNKDAKENHMTGKGRGLNLIIIQVESLQNFVIGKRYNGIEITPNLNRLAENGIYFSNIYDQTASGNTSDATFLSNVSLYPSRKGATSFMYYQNCFDSLPKVLNENGYTTAVMEAYRRNFWNNAIFDKTIGFKYQFYEDDYNMIEYNEIYGFKLGLSDREFLLQSLEKIKNLPKPFYVFMRTLSSHIPFRYTPAYNIKVPFNDIEGHTIGDYIKSIHYVDSAIGEFLRRLSDNGMIDQTVIVIFGDHSARLSEVELRKIGIDDLEEKRKIPLIVSCSCIKNKERPDTIGGLIDIAPTVLNILGINTAGKFFVGKDLMDKEDSFVVFKDGSSISKDGIINKSLAQEQLNISYLILEKNMIPKIRDCQ